MRVAMCCRSLPWELYGGMERNCWEATRALHRLGVNIELYSMCKSETREGIKIHQVAQPRIGVRPIDSQFYIFSLPRALPDDFDVYHFQGNAAYAYSFKHDNYVTTMHGIASHHQSHLPAGGFVRDFEEKRVLRRARKIIVVDHHTIGPATQKYGVPRSKFVYIPNGADLPSYFKQLPRKRTGFNFLFVGRLSVNKGLPTLLSAFEKFSEDARLVIVGEGQLDALMQKAVRIDKRIVWKKNLSERELWTEYKNCDAFVLPSTYEGFGITFIEAMVAEKPVIATNVGVMQEITAGMKRPDFIVPPDNSRLLLEKMKLYYEDASLRRKTGRLLAQKAAKYSWKNIAKQTLQVYEEVLDER